MAAVALTAVYDRFEGSGDGVAVLAPGVAECPSNQMDDAGLHHRVGKTALTDCGKTSSEAVADEEDVGHPRFFNSVSTASQYLPDSPVSFSGPRPHVAVTGSTPIAA